MKTSILAGAAMAAAVASLSAARAQPAPPGPDAAQQAPGAQPGVIASQPVPDTAHESPGIPGDQAVNPAPGAVSAYVGAGPKGFYDVDTRITQVQGRIDALPSAQRRKASMAVKSIRSEEATQRARHGGDLRDWDRENLNHRLDQLVAQYPGLGG